MPIPATLNVMKTPEWPINRLKKYAWLDVPYDETHIAQFVDSAIDFAEPAEGEIEPTERGITKFVKTIQTEMVTRLAQETRLTPLQKDATLTIWADANRVHEEHLPRRLYSAVLAFATSSESKEMCELSIHLLPSKHGPTIILNTS